MNPDIKIVKTEILSDNWYVLKKITVEHSKRSGAMQTYSREAYDRGKKASHYRQIESLQALVLVSQDTPKVEIHLRQSDGSWSPSQLDGMDKSLQIEAIGVTLSFALIYQGVDFTTDQ